MFWYIFLTCFPVALSVVFNTFKKSIKSNDKAKRIYLCICGFAMFLLIALRHNSVGSDDSFNYYNNWSYLQSLSFDSMKNYVPGHEMEAGYLYTVWALSKVFVNPQFVFVFSGLFFSIAVCRYIYINSKEPTISLVMFFCLGLYTFMVQGLRQSIAMSICLFAIEYCKEKKPIKFFVLIVIAMLFHKSAIAFAPVYFLSCIKLNAITYIGTFGVGTMLLAFSGPLIRYANIMYGSEYHRVADSGGFVAVAIYVIILVAAFILQKTYGNKKHYDLFFLLTFFGATFYSMRYIGGLIAGRISWYYMFGQLILLPNIVAKMEHKTRTLVKFAIITLCILLFAYRLHDSNLLIYRFFWE